MFLVLGSVFCFAFFGSSLLVEFLSFRGQVFRFWGFVFLGCRDSFFGFWGTVLGSRVEFLLEILGFFSKSGGFW